MSSDTEAVRMIRMMIRERDEWGYLPCIGINLTRLARQVIGIRRHSPNKEGIRKWEVPADWADKLKRAGIDPATLELVDHEAWQRTMKALEQAKANKKREWSREELHKSIKAATAKYMPPPTPSPSQVIANHVLTGRIARELQRGKDSI